jgi:hypothetical protein
MLSGWKNVSLDARICGSEYRRGRGGQSGCNEDALLGVRPLVVEAIILISCCGVSDLIRLRGYEQRTITGTNYESQVVIFSSWDNSTSRFFLY